MHINLAWPHLLIPMSSDMCDPPPARQAWGKLWEGPGSISHLASMVEGIRPWQRLSARLKFHQWLDVYLFWEKFGNFHLLAPFNFPYERWRLKCSAAAKLAYHSLSLPLCPHLIGRGHEPWCCTQKRSGQNLAPGLAAVSRAECCHSRSSFPLSFCPQKWDT